MLQKLNNTMKTLLLFIAVEAVLIFGYMFFTGKQEMLIPAVLVVFVECLIVIYAFERFRALSEENSSGLENMLGRVAAEGYVYGGVGLVTYDSDHVITAMSDLFKQRGIERIGIKLLEWLPECERLISKGEETATVAIGESLFEVTRVENEPVLLFRDISALERYRMAYLEERPVIGLANLDNYEESTQYEDESVVSAISVAVRSPLTEYCHEHGILIRRLNNYRYMLLLNEKIYNELKEDRFSVLNRVRRSAQKQDVSVTLSLAFAKGTSNYEELDEMATGLMDLAQSRGGDQVAVQTAGEEVEYFGGASEATEKRSRVRVRVMAHTLRELIVRSSNVIVVGHREQDFDCLGAAIGVAGIARALRRPVCVIERTGGVEEKLKAVVDSRYDELDAGLNFVTESEALNQLQSKSLVIMVDHHNIRTSNGAKVLEAAKKVVVLDHHRRSTEMGVKPVLMYIEAGASSAVELITELMPYITNQVRLSELEATIMLGGMIVDTDFFRVRTGARTYEAASYLRKMGADPGKANDFLKEDYDEFMRRNSIMMMAQNYTDHILIVPAEGVHASRSMISQVADRLLKVKNVDAVFVIAETGPDEISVSARSNGRINVQVVMEGLGGGGHMTAAAVQRAKTNVADLKGELEAKLKVYLQEESGYEGNTEN
ncbi:MAG: DHH family phosphoesterase [Erysipelotrichaceae bacterium]|nr:DHH family phosphoesterase [Erysipelotrichaceae bacterium]